MNFILTEKITLLNSVLKNKYDNSRTLGSLTYQDIFDITYSIEYFFMRSKAVALFNYIAQHYKLSTKVSKLTTKDKKRFIRFLETATKGLDVA